MILGNPCEKIVQAQRVTTQVENNWSISFPALILIKKVFNIKKKKKPKNLTQLNKYESFVLCSNTKIKVQALSFG